MKKVLYVVGAGLVVGAVAATLYCMNNKKKKYPRRLANIKNSMISSKQKTVNLQKISLSPRMSLCMRMLREVCTPGMKVQPPS